MGSGWQAFRIGPVEIASPVVLASLAGYSDLAYRRICRRLGAPYCATDMLLDRSVLARGKLRKRMLALTDDDHPVGGQLIGNDPSEMADAAGVLCEEGFDVVDLNFACPVRKALARRRGGFLMSRPEQAGRIVRAVVEAVDRPVTIKLRRSFREQDETREAFWTIAESAFEAGAAALCVHGRSVEAKYVGPADWGFLAEVKRRFPGRTIIGSGDVQYPADALRMLAETGVDAAAAARGALGNPWFFRQAADLAAGREAHRPSLAEQRDVLLEHFEQSCVLHGPVRGPRHMRKFGIKYARLHDQPKRLRAAFVAVSRPEQWRQVVQENY